MTTARAAKGSQLGFFICASYRRHSRLARLCRTEAPAFKDLGRALSVPALDVQCVPVKVTRRDSVEDLTELSHSQRFGVARGTADVRGHHDVGQRRERIVARWSLVLRRLGVQPPHVEARGIDLLVAKGLKKRFLIN